MQSESTCPSKWVSHTQGIRVAQYPAEELAQDERHAESSYVAGISSDVSMSWPQDVCR